MFENIVGHEKQKDILSKIIENLAYIKECLYNGQI